MHFNAEYSSMCVNDQECSKAFVYIRSLKRYRSNSQWTDGTIAYMFEIQQKLSASRTWEKCSLINLESGIFEGFPLILISCGLHEGKAFICEKQLKVESPTRLQIPVLTRNEEIQVLSYSVCPAGHVTHKFLSCDLQAACLRYYTSSMFFCGSSLLPPPPMFKCSSEMEQVPYPLVCDHRPDCRDFSDENFCVFRSCSGKSFHCGNKQVRSTHYWKLLVNIESLLTISSKRHIYFCCPCFCFFLSMKRWLRTLHKQNKTKQNKAKKNNRGKP